MIIRRPETGETFTTPGAAMEDNCNGRWCDDCPLNDIPRSCRFTLADDVEGTLRKMGYQIIHDVPRLCEALGVEADEPFSVGDYPVRFTIDSAGLPRWDNVTAEDLDALLAGVNHPERVHRLKKWTEQDVEDARMILRVWPDASDVLRVDSDLLEILHANGIGENINPGMFPSVKSEKAVKLADILGGAK